MAHSTTFYMIQIQVSCLKQYQARVHGVCCITVIKINIEEGVKFAQDICHGMAYLHSLEPLISGFDLNPHHVFVRN